jgi:hypothetical protein
MRMRQSMSELEEAFAEEVSLEQRRREHIRRTAAKRSLRRDVDRRHKHGTIRYVLLVLTLILTAVIVTVVMFRTLAILLN